MTHRDPDNASVTNSNDPYHREWGSGSVTATIVAIVIMVGIIAYGATTATKRLRIVRRCLIGLLVKLTPVLSKVA